jgi:hypothetical protein
MASLSLIILSNKGYIQLLLQIDTIRKEKIMYCPLKNHKNSLIYFFKKNVTGYCTEKIRNKHKLDDREPKLPASSSLMTAPGQSSLSIASHFGLGSQR